MVVDNVHCRINAQWFCEAGRVNNKTNSQRYTNGKNCLAVDVSTSIFRNVNMSTLDPPPLHSPIVVKLLFISSLFLPLFLKTIQLLTAGHTFLRCNFIAICTEPITQENIGDTVVEGEFSIAQKNNS